MAVRFDPVPVEHGVLSWNRAINAGLMGAAAMTALMLVVRELGLSHLNLELFLGSMATQTLGFGPWALGLGIHLMVGAGIGVAYAALMEAFERSGFGAGLAIGALHALLAGLLLPVLGAAHPLVRAGSLPPPGLFGAGMGGAAPVFFILLHLLYGAIVGRTYVVLAPAAAQAAPTSESARRPPTALRRG